MMQQQSNLQIPLIDRVSFVGEYQLMEAPPTVRSNSSPRVEIAPKALYGNAQTILQETMQTDTANVIGLGTSSSAKSNKSTSQFMELQLKAMKKKHRQLQQQLSEVSTYETSAQKSKTLLQASKSAATISQSRAATGNGLTGFTAGGSVGGFSNWPSSSKFSKANESETIGQLLETLQSVAQFTGKKEIEVRVERSGLAETVKHLLEQFNTLTARYGDLNSENCTLKMLYEAAQLENGQLKDANQNLNEEIKNTKTFLSDTRVELERMKTHFDILERKYIDVLKQKQEVKIINKETIREVVVERPIETIKYVVNQKIVKKNKEVRKIVRAKPDQKITITEKLHVVNREVHVPTVITLEKIVEVPRREIVEIDRFVDRPVFVDKPVFVDRTIEVPGPTQVINRYIETPIRQEINTPIIHQIRTADPMQEREKQHLLNVNSQLKRDNMMLTDENRFFRHSHMNLATTVHPPPLPQQVVHHHLSSSSSSSSNNHNTLHFR